MIPKTIHYCWFGGAPLPELAQRCLESWKKFCPDWEILCWDEKRMDLSTAPLYVRQAYEARRWAFVSDYVRLRALSEVGGVYLDTDVELVKPLDPFRTDKAFGGFEFPQFLSTGVIACEKGFPVITEFLHHYDHLSFLQADGSADLTTNPMVFTEIMLRHGLVPDGHEQEVAGMHLYPIEVFSPLSYLTGRLKKTRRTVAIHWFSGSWQTEEERKAKEEHLRQQKQARLRTIPNRMLRRLLGDDTYEKIKHKAGRG